MSRVIKFRAKRIDNGKWIYGHYQKVWDNIEYLHQIMSDHLLNGKPIFSFIKPIDPKTVGQWTGLKDKNGKDVFDGDLKSWKFNNHDRIYLCYWSELDCGFRWKLVKHNEKQDLTDETHVHYDTEEDYYDYVINSNQRQHGMDQWSEVIGNKHQDTQLLK